jgi:hypothetical protein
MPPPMPYTAGEFNGLYHNVLDIMSCTIYETREILALNNLLLNEHCIVSVSPKERADQTN